MAVIHHTTMTPGKLELLATWLPSRPWYVGGGREPELAKAGGFRLDDPDGEVGIEFMVVTDVSADPPVTYLVPLGYRGAPLDGADHTLVATSEHGVLGRRWVYDGLHDPVVVAQLLALLQGRAEAQHQSVNDTPDRSVIAHFAGACFDAAPGSVVVTDGPESSELLVRNPITTPSMIWGVRRSSNDVERPRSWTAPMTDDDQPARQVTVAVARVLRPDRQAPEIGPTGTIGHLTAAWRLPDGDENRGLFAVLRDTVTP